MFTYDILKKKVAFLLTTILKNLNQPPLSAWSKFSMQLKWDSMQFIQSIHPLNLLFFNKLMFYSSLARKFIHEMQKYGEEE